MKNSRFIMSFLFLISISFMFCACNSSAPPTTTGYSRINQLFIEDGIYHWKDLNWGVPKDVMVLQAGITEDDLYPMGKDSKIAMLRHDSPKRQNFHLSDLADVASDYDFTFTFDKEDRLSGISYAIYFNATNQPDYESGKTNKFVLTDKSNEDVKKDIDFVLKKIEETFGSPTRAFGSGKFWLENGDGSDSAVEVKANNYFEERLTEKGSLFTVSVISEILEDQGTSYYIGMNLRATE